MSKKRHLRVIKSEEEHARDEQARVLHDTTSRDEVARRAQAEARQNTERMGLPVQWQDGHTGRRYRGRNMVPIHQATEKEIKNFAQAPRSVCGTCRYFDLENGRREMVKQRFAERLVREEEWKLKHLGVPFDSIGLCGQSNGELAVATVSPGCDNWRGRGRF